MQALLRSRVAPDRGLSFVGASRGCASALASRRNSAAQPLFKAGCQPHDVGQLAVADDPVHEAVLAAFRAAEKRGRPPHECYMAAVAVYRRFFADYAHEPAARLAVNIVLASRQNDLLPLD